MKHKELIEFLQHHDGFLQRRLDEALASVSSLTPSNEKLTATVEELRRQIVSLEDMLKGKGSEPDKEKAARQAVQRLLGPTSEKQTKPQAKPVGEISLTHRRLTIGSHAGAETAALYHSLAITCHRCGVNIFEYFCDIIDRCVAWHPNTPIEKYRNLLPDRWKPTQK